ncbi:hypothetical protein SHKM778_48420 [Streptomyces sp. KM77-8]|uniref:Uncharacterized protein n=1 Tax=Streptomyces haneummycinicus TaxID=3074435 RepID=A0AAT9HM71_9ACTN
MFLDDPTDGPAEAVDCLAEQLGVAEVSVVKERAGHGTQPLYTPEAESR